VWSKNEEAYKIDFFVVQKTSFNNEATKKYKVGAKQQDPKYF
jgi:hypothetical protein